MTFRATLAILCLSVAAVHAQSDLRAPRAAVVRYQGGALHALYGLGSSYIVDRSPVGSAVASAFSDHFGLTADGTSIALLDENFTIIARVACSETKPILAIGEAATTAVAWLPSQSTLLTFDGQSFATLTVSGMLSGSLVTAVSKRSDSVVRLLQIQTDGSVVENLISSKNGQVTSSRLVAEAHGTAALFLGSVVSVYGGKLHASIADGSAPPFEISFDDTAVAFEQCSSRGLHIASATDARHWILYRENKQFVLAELPAVTQ